MKKILFTFLLSLLLGAGITLAYIQQEVSHYQTKQSEEVHIHANFAMFINGERFDFSQEAFMSNKPCAVDLSWFIPSAQAHGGEYTGDLEDAIHLHDNDGNTIHVHAAGIRYEDFFASIGMLFDDVSFTDHEGNTVSNTDENTWRFFINNEEVSDLAEREIQDLDRVLISYGNGENVTQEMTKVAHTACVFSGSCPDRGEAPAESCGASEHTPWILKFLRIN